MSVNILSIYTARSVGRIPESDIFGITAMIGNNRNIQHFVGCNYPAYAGCPLANRLYGYPIVSANRINRNL